MTTGRPPAPVPQEPADPTARASLELPLLFQPHADLEKTSGGGASTEQPAASPNVNGVSQSQDSEAAGFEAITAEEPFRGYSFEVSFLLLPHLPWPLFVAPRRCIYPFPSLPPSVVCSRGYNPLLPELTCHHPLSPPDLDQCRNYDVLPMQIT